jgi:hypothetical protein
MHVTPSTADTFPFSRLYGTSLLGICYRDLCAPNGIDFRRIRPPCCECDLMIADGRSVTRLSLLDQQAALACVVCAFPAQCRRLINLRLSRARAPEVARQVAGDGHFYMLLRRLPTSSTKVRLQASGVCPLRCKTAQVVGRRRRLLHQYADKPLVCVSVPATKLSVLSD